VVDSLWSAHLATVLAGVVAGLILGSLAGGLVLYLAYVRGQVRSSLRWPSAVGMVTGTAARAHRTDGSTSHYFPTVSYAYAVAGRQFTGSRVAFGPAAHLRGYATAEQAMAHYTIGGQLPVYYNPRNPGEAVLERRGATAMVWVVAGFVFLLTATVPICMVIAALAAMSGGA
jgi:hypothetical protein